ncbi:MAG: cellulase family glycosylhydrolase [Chloroflexi bacterium]|nr:cellulase family glycosylhydrolase [Chloroflexota bacterium]
MTGTKPSHAFFKQSKDSVVIWIALALVCIGVVGLVWLLFFNQPAQPVAPAATRTPRPTFTTSEQAVQPSVTPVPPQAVATQTPLATAPVQPTATQLQPTVTPVLPTVTPIGPTAAPTPTPLPPVPPPKPLRMNSPEYGMQAFLWWRPEVASRDMGMIKEAGFGWVKQNIGWRDVEGAAKGVFDWSRVDWIVYECNKLGLDLLVRIDHQPQWAGGNYPTNGPPNNYADLGDFLYAMASRYKGRIRAYEIWNEPNLAREWGGRPPNAAQYVRLLKEAYRRIKQADPNAMVISAGLSPTGTYSPEATPDDVYLEQMYQAMGGNSDGYFDVLGVHAAGYKAPPELSPDEAAKNPYYGGQRFFCFRRVEDLRRIMEKYGDADKQIAVLEFGWTSDPIHPEYSWHAIDEETKADYFVRAYKWAKENWSPWIGLMSLIYIADPDWTEANEQYWWAISEPGYPDFRPRPAYLKLKAMSK